ncbi:hypothetical protein DMB66_18065 [Actinoplanes sp. ATCC 53533]|nr:hypothetical protein DMB66_18065 [Actinoplanes sp. ATCC 53533]
MTTIHVTTIGGTGIGVTGIGKTDFEVAGAWNASVGLTGSRAILRMGIRVTWVCALQVIRLTGVIGMVRNALVGQDQADDVPAYAGRATATPPLIEAAGRQRSGHPVVVGGVDCGFAVLDHHRHGSLDFADRPLDQAPVRQLRQRLGRQCPQFRPHGNLRAATDAAGRVATAADGPCRLRCSLIDRPARRRR